MEDLVLNIGTSSKKRALDINNQDSELSGKKQRKRNVGDDSHSASAPSHSAALSSVLANAAAVKPVEPPRRSSGSTHSMTEEWVTGTPIDQFLSDSSRAAPSGAAAGKPASSVSSSSPPAAGTAAAAAGGHRVSPNNSAFSKLGISCPGLQFSLNSMKIDRPTPIQTALVPKVLEERNLLAMATTGTGKTFAYAIPIIEQLYAATKGDRQARDRALGTRVLVIVPTRELATQTSEQFQALSQPHQDTRWLVSGCLCGGVKPKSEKLRLKKGLPVLVATPGRLLYHLKHTASFSLTHLSHIVMDEADRLADPGFRTDMLSCFSYCRQKMRPQQQDQQQPTAPRKPVQLVCVSATISSTLAFAEECVDSLNAGLVSAATPAKPVETVVVVDQPVGKGPQPPHSTAAAGASEPDGASDAAGGAASAPPEALTQLYVLVPAGLRLAVLTGLLRRLAGSKIIVFFSSIASVNFHYALLSYVQQSNAVALKQPALYCLHGDKPQQERTDHLNAFAASRRTGVLLCTDVAARGLHLPSVDWVVHFDAPSLSDDYLHRSGRTARMGDVGHSLLFLSPQERGFVDFLQSNLHSNPLQIALSSIVKRVDQAEQQKLHFIQLINSPHDSQSVEQKQQQQQQQQQQKQQKQQQQQQKQQQERMSKKNQEGGTDQKNTEGNQSQDAGGDQALSALLPLGRAAFLSFCRAYRTHERATRQFFDARKLPLGPIASSFGLRDIPSDVVNKLVDKKQVRLDKEREQTKKRAKETKNRLKVQQKSEFDSGLF